MAGSDWWARGISLASFLAAALSLYLSRRDRRPRVWVYSHYASGTVGSVFQSAHASAIGPGESAIQPAFRNLYLIVICDRETELSKAWFQFGDRIVDADSAQPTLPVRLLPHQTWQGWIAWDRVPEGVAEDRAPLRGRAILTVTGHKVHAARPTPPNLKLGGNVPGPNFRSTLPRPVVSFEMNVTDFDKPRPDRYQHWARTKGVAYAIIKITNPRDADLVLLGAKVESAALQYPKWLLATNVERQLRPSEAIHLMLPMSEVASPASITLYGHGLEETYAFPAASEKPDQLDLERLLRHWPDFEAKVKMFAEFFDYSKVCSLARLLQSSNGIDLTKPEDAALNGKREATLAGLGLLNQLAFDLLKEMRTRPTSIDTARGVVERFRTLLLGPARLNVEELYETLGPRSREPAEFTRLMERLRAFKLDYDSFARAANQHLGGEFFRPYIP